ncbi:hypothetical protein B0T26DRAFT_874672 [Lasiosphaeria miniovina]|uniref:Uncharacterized protein n=1 Tax=Lasiosphaeria miniovina TaxID=1954250 RepID=A0AA40A5E7_9PEZI|nr:uncharacterized protein B0T26DRAFT_874672 [Lasiosphaeria miniovina]KAK0709644.1 hypothetical protein B0T26DRAFT_874672 [Lasiosphaeria miniovina]
MGTMTDTLPVTYRFEAWYYGDPNDTGNRDRAFVKALQKRMPSKRWNVYSVNIETNQKKAKKAATQTARNATKEGAMPNVPSKDVFLCLEVHMRTDLKRAKKAVIYTNTRDGKYPTAEGRAYAEVFDKLYTYLVPFISEPKFASDVGLNKPLCWSLSSANLECKTTGGHRRWCLMPPGEPTDMPAKKIEKTLYDLARINVKKRDKAHKLCGGGGVLECIDNHLYRQKQTYDLLSDLMSKMVSSSEVTPEMVEDNVSAIEGVDKALTTVVSMFQQHVGRSPAPSSRCGVFRAVQKMFQPKFGAIAIDDDVIEELKKSTRLELGQLQRLAPVLAAHVRLQKPENWKKLKADCASALEGDERNVMPDKMGISSKWLGDMGEHAAALRLVRAHYDIIYNRLLADIEALNKAVGAEYVRRGATLFRSTSTPRNGCLVEARLHGLEPKRSLFAAAEECEKV